MNLMSDATSVNSVWDRRRWLTLGVIGIAQLMIVLDVTVMNIALPSAQHALHFTTVDRQWVVTAYTLTFGSLLLLGGRLADLLGRKTTFLAGLAGFAVVSAIGGASVSFAMLITARACQGAFAALLVPSALSLAHKKQAPLGPRRDLSGGQIAGQDRKRAPRDGSAAQPGHQHPAPGWPHEHRRRQPPSRPRPEADAKPALGCMNTTLLGRPRRIS